MHGGVGGWVRGNSKLGEEEGRNPGWEVEREGGEFQDRERRGGEKEDGERERGREGEREGSWGKKRR